MTFKATKKYISDCTNEYPKMQQPCQNLYDTSLICFPKQNQIKIMTFCMLSAIRNETMF